MKEHLYRIELFVLGGLIYQCESWFRWVIVGYAILTWFCWYGAMRLKK